MLLHSFLSKAKVVELIYAIHQSHRIARPSITHSHDQISTALRKQVKQSNYMPDFLGPHSLIRSLARLPI